MMEYSCIEKSRPTKARTAVSAWDVVDCIIGTGDGWLIEALRCFSVKEGNGTNTCIHAFFIILSETPWTSQNSVLNYYAQYPSALLLRLI